MGGYGGTMITRSTCLKHSHTFIKATVELLAIQTEAQRIWGYQLILHCGEEKVPAQECFQGISKLLYVYMEWQELREEARQVIAW